MISKRKTNIGSDFRDFKIYCSSKDERESVKANQKEIWTRQTWRQLLPGKDPIWNELPWLLQINIFCSTYNVDFNTAQNGPTIRQRITKFLHCYNLTRATSQCSAWSVLKVGSDKTTPNWICNWGKNIFKYDDEIVCEEWYAWELLSLCTTTSKPVQRLDAPRGACSSRGRERRRSEFVITTPILSNHWKYFFTTGSQLLS